MAQDVLEFMRLFPSAKKSCDRIPALEILCAVRQTARELRRAGPMDLADIDVEEPEGRRVRVRCLLR
ncbi:MAG: hypothetical protein LKJ17_10800 [Oscillospiraceae bacterium]|jgi:hypothetical protein|nr:hypothetical protein [Oscillospiraceae bacterium]